MDEKLPETRKGAFLDCYRRCFPTLLRLGLLCVVFFLPLLIVRFLKESCFLGAYEMLENPTDELIAAINLRLNIIFGLLDTGSFLLFVMLFSGVVQVVRQLLWREMYSFGSDFRTGLKSNLSGFFVSALPIAVPGFLLRCLPPSLSTNLLYWGLLTGILPVCIWSILQTVYYQLGFWAKLRNAAIFYIRTLPVTLLLMAVTLIPFYLTFQLSPLLIGKYLALILLALFYLVPVTIVWLLYASHIFDQLINESHYPAIYRKGLRR